MKNKIQILYIHGTNGRKSNKVRILKEMVKSNFNDGEVEVEEFKQDILSPLNTFNNLCKYVEDFYNNEKGRLFLIGSSRGGLLAFLISQIYDIPVLLINPLLSKSKKKIKDDIVSNIEEQLNIDNDIDLLLSKIDEVEYNPYITNFFLSNNDEIVDNERTVDKFKHFNVMKHFDDNHRFEHFDKITLDIKDIITKYYR